jgi:hypothetical protein
MQDTGAIQDDPYDTRRSRDNPWNYGNFNDDPSEIWELVDASHTGLVNDEFEWPSCEDNDEN